MMLPDLRQNGMRYDGSLPIGWKIEPAQRACTKITDGTHDTPTPVSTGRPFITAIHVKNGSINFEDCLYLTEADHREIFKRCNAQRGDLAIVNIGAGVGECGYVDVDFEFSMKNVALLKPNPKILDSLFLLHLHQSRKDRIAHVVRSGGAQPFLSLTELKKLPILLPPLPEQKRIAEILSTWDFAIETVEALIANARAQKKALMQSLLTGKRRLPGFSGDWANRTVSDVAEITTGKSKSEFIDAKGKYLIIDMGSVTRTGALVSTKPTNNSEDILVLGDLIMPKDDIGGGNIIGRVAKIDREQTYVLGDHVYLLRSKRQFSPDFLQYVINSHPVNKALRRKANGTAQLGLGKADVQKTWINVPEHAEQCAIAAILMLADSDLIKLGDQLTTLRQEKSALMQQLLTGKRRVKINEKEDG